MKDCILKETNDNAQASRMKYLSLLGTVTKVIQSKKKGIMKMIHSTKKHVASNQCKDL